MADMLLIAGLFARANGCNFDQQYWRALESMLDFLASIMDVSGGVPAIGDADQGVLARMVRAGDGPWPGVYRSLLASGAVLFGRPELISSPLSVFGSTPVTTCPQAARHAADTAPTYPSPKMLTLIALDCRSAELPSRDFARTIP
ncbi:MAG: hypothetical protein WBE91_22585 [Steroidobacteraceae bacterium]